MANKYYYHTVSIPSELYIKLKEKALENDRSANAQCIHILRCALSDLADGAPLPPKIRVTADYARGENISPAPKSKLQIMAEQRAVENASNGINKKFTN